jgi:hypothetical protein
MQQRGWVFAVTLWSPAAILSDFVVRAIEIAAAINRGCHGNLDRPRADP